jgi:hypothetical protein
MDYAVLPRYVGNPSQYLVSTAAQFKAFVDFNDGRNPCYTSHNAWPSETVTDVRYVPFDFDSKEKPENALVDVLALRDWARNLGLTLVNVFTGSGHGWHSYLEFKPALEHANAGLREVYRALQMKAVREAKLRTADPAIIGDYRRILRLVGCQYVSSKTHERSGFRTVEVPPALLDTGGLDDIKDYARVVRPPVSVFPPVETLAEAVVRLALEREAPSMDFEPSGAPTIAYRAVGGSAVAEMARNYLPRPCIHQGIMERNPSHPIRFDAVVELKEMGQDIATAREIIHAIALEAQWADFDPKITDGHIRQIYRQDYGPVSCSKIRSIGACVGSVCPFFAARFPEEVPADGATHA